MEEQTNQNQPEMGSGQSEPNQPMDNQSNQGNGSESNDVKENKGITFLSYIGILFLVPLLAKKESKFAVFHAKQGLVITIGWFLGSFLYALFGLGILVHLALVILSIMGLINVSAGKMKALPVVGGIAEKINI
jgi:uncharacterized membrane protein